jgi:hypothetical protein
MGTVLAIETLHSLPLLLAQHEERTLLFGKSIGIGGRLLQVSEFITLNIVGAG